jgi:hypothetical protein
MSDPPRIYAGQMITLQQVICARCGDGESYDSTSKRDAAAQARRDGWTNRRDEGWICLYCIDRPRLNLAADAITNSPEV